MRNRDEFIWSRNIDLLDYVSIRYAMRSHYLRLNAPILETLEEFAVILLRFFGRLGFTAYPSTTSIVVESLQIVLHLFRLRWLLVVLLEVIWIRDLVVLSLHRSDGGSRYQ